MHRRTRTILALGLLAFPLQAFALTQEEVLKSISSNVSGAEPSISHRLMAALLAAASIAIALAVLLNWRHRQTHRDGELHDPAQLARTVASEAGLSRAQLRQLETLRRNLQRQGVNVQSPLTILLCPSLAQPLAESQQSQELDDPETHRHAIGSSDPPAL